MLSGLGKLLLMAAVLPLITSGHRRINQRSRCDQNAVETIYDVDHAFTSLHDGRNHSLSEFKGDVIMIINTASF